MSPVQHGLAEFRSMYGHTGRTEVDLPTDFYAAILSDKFCFVSSDGYLSNQCILKKRRLPRYLNTIAQRE